MASYLDGLSGRDLRTLASITGGDADQLAEDLRLRPWAIHDILSDEDVFAGVMGRQAHPANVVSPYLLFAVMVHAAADELRTATFVNDWTGPQSRLPVFDVAPLQEFVEDPGRLFFLVRLLDSFAMPAPAPVPADPFDLNDMALWIDQALPSQRATLMCRLGDLSLFMSGVFPDHAGPRAMPATEAEQLGGTVDMTSDEILQLCDRGSLSPGLDALEHLGSRWYERAVDAGSAPPVVADVATRFRAARRVLNHLSDRFLHEIDFNWNEAA
ncbi:MAG: hypothetical protein QNJ77_15540 [Acidimicrobiia bacterium]|nr:hypothetical protein [Acidimicrobiia bacterium]